MLQMVNLIAQVSKALKRQPRMLNVSLIHTHHGISSFNITISAAITMQFNTKEMTCSTTS